MEHADRRHLAMTTAMLLAVLLLLLPAVPAAALCDRSDKAALLAVKSALGNPPALSDWNTSAAADDCCSWAGVSCDGDAGAAGRVTALTVYGRGTISARVPAALANLTALRTLNLPYNRLYGAVPAFLGPPALPYLAFLRLDGNRLSGAVPPALAVPDLSLVGNRLSGPLPASFANAVFADLDLSDNRLTGDASLLFGAGKQQLTALRLSRNRFEFDLGRVELPEAIDVLEIDGNLIYGSIPADAAARKWLAFNVSYNQLCGSIPQGRYTHRFGPSHFAGNKCLCDRPLPPCTGA